MWVWFVGLLGLLKKVVRRKPSWRVVDLPYQRVVINGRVYYVHKILEVRDGFVKFIDRRGVVRSVPVEKPFE